MNLGELWAALQDNEDAPHKARVQITGNTAFGHIDLEITEIEYVKPTRVSRNNPGRLVIHTKGATR